MRSAILAGGQNSGAQARSVALDRLREGLAHVRHIKVAFAAPPRVSEGAAQNAARAPRPQASAPAWFGRLLKPATIEKTYAVETGGAAPSEIVMTSEPGDEIAEIWASLLFLTALLAAISIAIVALILVTARHTLAPLRQLVDGLDRLGRGQFSAVGEIKITELRRIGDHFNQLAATLARSEADNHLLIDRLLSIQDAERKGTGARAAR